MKKHIAIEWKQGRPEGVLEITHGQLGKISVVRGKGFVDGKTFRFESEASCRLEIVVAEAATGPGAGASILAVNTRENPFSFFLRDVQRQHPICIPSLGVAVTEAADRRTYQAIEKSIQARKRLTALERIEREPEESYEVSAAHTRNLKCETWLGLSRDFRIFAFNFRSHNYRWDWIQPRFHGFEVKAPETGDKGLKYDFMIGRGLGCTQQITRRLEDGVLPILHATLLDGDIAYHVTAFATLETRSLTAKNLRGTHFLVADGHGHGHMFTDEQKNQFEDLLPKEMDQPETILCCRVKAVNTAAVPRYAWFLAPDAQGIPNQTVDADGFSPLPSGRVFCVNKFNGKPLGQRETAVLVPPGEAAVFEFYLPHRPVAKERAARIAEIDFDKRHAECRAFWLAKLDAGARLHLPEQRVDEMARAGLLHLDLVAYGLEPKGALAPTIGVYNPIGSESSPIIQFFDSMGWHDVAERALQYFLDKQHDDGFIQNFGGYMLETGPALWSMGEHWRYTRDEAWLKRVAPKLVKSCDFLLRWRERNKRPELQGKGYGMLEGKCADPEDPNRAFMLNGYACIGLSRVAEMLQRMNPAESKRLAEEAKAMKQDIRSSLMEAIAKSPVVPLGDGSWCPTCPPWVEDRGALMLYAKPDRIFTHGAFTGRDSLLGPLYLLMSEVIEPHERATDWLVNFHAELMTDRNAGFTQPYYCRHDFAHIRRDEVKAFLKTYYNQFASLADRETYTFWEHYYGCSPHKTHEEGWFLMQTRWMLYREEGNLLRCLGGIPRVWLENGKTIELKNVASYFGPFSLRVKSRLDQGVIEAWLRCASDRQPQSVEIRLPHPLKIAADRATGGVYDPVRETVRIDNFRNEEKVALQFRNQKSRQKERRRRS
ncbi:MAG: hypothetical protein HY360_09490 [Verrucomicrobia bacterium]|nr:hypothetical protein [Verrucomicrobiota bacterium]